MFHLRIFGQAPDSVPGRSAVRLREAIVEALAELRVGIAISRGSRLVPGPPRTASPSGGKPLKAKAAFIAALALLAVPATAQASAVIDVNCDRVRIDYTQWPSGPPDSSHTSVRVDGGVRFDEVVSFSGTTHTLEIPLNLNDGKQHTIEAKHDWIGHEAGSREVDATLTCGSPPPAAPPAPPQDQPPAPPAPPAPAPAAPTAPGGAVPVSTTAPASAPLVTQQAEARRANRRRAERRRQRIEARRERQRIQRRGTAHRPPRSTG